MTSQYARRGLWICKKRPIIVRICKKWSIMWGTWPVNMEKEAYEYVNKGLSLWVKSDLWMCTKRPINMEEEAYEFAKRDLSLWVKSDLTMCTKRPSSMSEKWPINVEQEAYEYVKTELSLWLKSDLTMCTTICLVMSRCAHDMSRCAHC